MSDRRVCHVLALNAAARVIRTIVVNRRRLKVIVSQQGQRRGLLVHLLGRHILKQYHLIVLLLQHRHQTVLFMAIQCGIAHD